MNYKVLSLKWRPSQFDQVIGQDHITQALSNAIKLDRLAHAFTFSGPRGVGKTSTARILAKTINEIENLSDSIDVIEMDAASNRGIDEIRNLKESVNYTPVHGKYKIYIIDEVHMLTKEAFNALLKTLEEPPPYVLFILATTELHKMPETIISRTQRYDFKRLTIEDIKKQLVLILNDEKIKFDSESLSLIAQKADGSMRDALSILDQIICYCNNDLSFDEVQKALGVVTTEQYFKLLSLVGKRKIKSIITLVNSVLNQGVAINQFIEGYNQFLRDLILSKTSVNQNSDSVKIDVAFSELDLLRILDMCLKFQINIKNFKQPQIVLETLMIKLSYLDNTIDIAKLIHENKLTTDSNINSQDLLNKSSVISRKNNASEIIENKKNNSIDKVEKAQDDNGIKDKEKKVNSDRKSENDIDDLNVREAHNSIVKITLDEIKDNWPKIIELINDKNSKTAIFLEDIIFEKIDNQKLFILVKEANEFSVKSLEKDKKSIEDIINQVLNSKISLFLNYDTKKNNDDDLNKKDSKIKSDEDHPLFMNVLDKFDGKLIN